MACAPRAALARARSAPGRCPVRRRGVQQQAPAPDASPSGAHAAKRATSASASTSSAAIADALDLSSMGFSGAAAAPLKAPLASPAPRTPERPRVKPPEKPESAGPSPRSDGPVPVNVMLPLDTVGVDNTLNYKRALAAGLRALRSVGVEGVMVDVWWGVVERDEPGVYDWSAYLELAELVTEAGLKLQCVMSFHACGGNVNDCCLVSLPLWVLEEAEANPDILFTDREGARNCEYLSFAVDELPLLRGRTPVHVYADFCASFRHAFADYLGESGTIQEVSVGMGPAGEMRFPSYPQGDTRWSFPGVGEFQCYDKYMLSTLEACAELDGVPKWGHGGPHNAGRYNSRPWETDFFTDEAHGSWRTPYGHWFLDWYSGALIAHGERVASAASEAFAGSGVRLNAKLPGIHWMYDSCAHAAELTAGFYNTCERDGYTPVLEMLARHSFGVSFTCAEMRDVEQPQEAHSSPERLLEQVCSAAARCGVEVSGENALPRYDAHAHTQMVQNAYRPAAGGAGRMSSMTFLRMGEGLFKPDAWVSFVQFARTMSMGPSGNPVHGGAEAQ